MNSYGMEGQMLVEIHKLIVRQISYVNINWVRTQSAYLGVTDATTVLVEHGLTVSIMVMKTSTISTIVWIFVQPRLIH